jgi:hypothetical protein
LLLLEELRGVKSQAARHFFSCRFAGENLFRHPARAPQSVVSESESGERRVEVAELGQFCEAYEVTVP